MSNPILAQLDAAKSLGVSVIELHTGAFCNTHGQARARELSRIQRAAAYAASLGLECHAGHGLGFETVGSIAGIPEIAELNIGHFIIGEAIFSGLDSTVKRMRDLMDTARASVLGEIDGLILGIGNDLIDIRRIEQTLDRFGRPLHQSHLH